jgi:hypothetical protein
VSGPHDNIRSFVVGLFKPLQRREHLGHAARIGLELGLEISSPGQRHQALSNGTNRSDAGALQRSALTGAAGVVVAQVGPPAAVGYRKRIDNGTPSMASS